MQKASSASVHQLWNPRPDDRETDPKLREEGRGADFKLGIRGFLVSTCHNGRYRTFNARLCYLFVTCVPGACTRPEAYRLEPRAGLE